MVNEQQIIDVLKSVTDEEVAVKRLMEIASVSRVRAVGIFHGWNGKNEQPAQQWSMYQEGRSAGSRLRINST